MAAGRYVDLNFDGRVFHVHSVRFAIVRRDSHSDSGPDRGANDCAITIAQLFSNNRTHGAANGSTGGCFYLLITCPGDTGQCGCEQRNRENRKLHVS